MNVNLYKIAAVVILAVLVVSPLYAVFSNTYNWSTFAMRPGEGEELPDSDPENIPESQESGTQTPEPEANNGAPEKVKFKEIGKIETASEETPADDCNAPAARVKVWGDITSLGTDSGRATARIYNDSINCKYIVGFASYKVNSPNDRLDNQTLFDHVTYEIGPKQTIGSGRLNIAVPNCRYQLDLFIGTPRVPPFYDGNSLLDYDFARTNLCSQGAGPTPAPKTPAPRAPPTPVPTPAPAPKNIQPGTLSASCGGNSVHLTWTSGVNTNSNSLQKGDFYPNDPNRFWEFIFQDPTGNVRSFTDTNVTPGVTYSYRVKYAPEVSSNVVNISCGITTPTPTPTPTPTATPVPTLFCSPSSQNVQSGQFANFSASGGLNIYFWNAPSGNPQFGFSRNFSTQLFTSQSEEIKTVTVESGNQIASCIVRVLGSRPVPNPVLNISKTVRNVSTNSNEVETVSATVGDTVEFIIRVSDFGDSNANNVRVSDILPGGLKYVSGSTTLDGNFQNDGITSGGIFIGTLSANQTRIIRFRATVENVGTSFLINTSNASGDNVSTVSDTANVSILFSGVQGQLGIQKLGRNISRGQTSERTVVTVSPGDTVEFIIRVRNNTGATIYNVVVADILPGALNYINGTTTINGVVTANGITTSGINIGSLASGQETTIRFSTNVGTFIIGTTIENIATAQADNVPLVSSRISLNRGQVAGAGTVKTGTTNSLILALLLSGVVTYGYMLYTKTEIFRRRNLVTSVQRIQSDSHRLNFARFL